MKSNNPKYVSYYYNYNKGFAELLNDYQNGTVSIRVISNNLHRVLCEMWRYPDRLQDILIISQEITLDASYNGNSFIYDVEDDEVLICKQLSEIGILKKSLYQQRSILSDALTESKNKDVYGGNYSYIINSALYRCNKELAKIIREEHNL